MALFDSDFLQQLEYLSLVSRRVFRGQLLAQRRSRQLGGGIEFADHRDYHPGDDLRYLDWNIYARHGQLLLKRFLEEADLHVYLLVDCSLSMRAGSPTKFDLARRTAAALAYIALADLDRVSVTAFADDVVDTYPLGRGKQLIVKIMDFLERLAFVGHDTNLLHVADQFVHRTSRAGVVVLLSDLFDPHGFEDGIERFRVAGFDPHLVQFYAPEEADPSLRGDLELVDVETGQSREVTVNEKLLAAYRRRFEHHLEAVRRYANARALACVQTSTDITFDSLILKMMRKSRVLD